MNLNKQSQCNHINSNIVRGRILSGWDEEKALSTPVLSFEEVVNTPILMSNGMTVSIPNYSDIEEYYYYDGSVTYIWEDSCFSGMDGLCSYPYLVAHPEEFHHPDDRHIDFLYEDREYLKSLYLGEMNISTDNELVEIIGIGDKWNELTLLTSSGKVLYNKSWSYFAGKSQDYFINRDTLYYRPSYRKIIYDLNLFPGRTKRQENGL